MLLISHLFCAIVHLIVFLWYIIFVDKSPDELKKTVRKLRKKLRQIEGLEAKPDSELTDAEKSKVASKGDLEDEIFSYESALNAWT